MLKTFSDQRGFTLLEILITVSILGILATIAIPKFEGYRAMANTAKIQSDLQTIDSAIIVYEMESGNTPTSTNWKTQLANYIDTSVKPPSGKCYISTGEHDISAEEYGITDGRASLDGKIVTEFGKSSSGS